MTCEEFEIPITALALGEPAPDDPQTAQLQQHLATCPACREKLADLRVTANLLHQAAATPGVLHQPTLSPQRRLALRTAIAAESAPHRPLLFRLPYRPIGIAAALGLIMIGGIGYMQFNRLDRKNLELATALNDERHRREIADANATVKEGDLRETGRESSGATWNYRTDSQYASRSGGSPVGGSVGGGSGSGGPGWAEGSRAPVALGNTTNLFRGEIDGKISGDNGKLAYDDADGDGIRGSKPQSGELGRSRAFQHNALDGTIADAGEKRATDKFSVGQNAGDKLAYDTNSPRRVGESGGLKGLDSPDTGLAAADDSGRQFLTKSGSGTLGLSGGTVKTGTGTMTLSGTNTYTGGTTVAAGTLQLGEPTKDAKAPTGSTHGTLTDLAAADPASSLKPGGAVPRSAAAPAVTPAKPTPTAPPREVASAPATNSSNYFEFEGETRRKLDNISGAKITGDSTTAKDQNGRISDELKSDLRNADAGTKILGEKFGKGAAAAPAPAAKLSTPRDQDAETGKFNQPAQREEIARADLEQRSTRGLTAASDAPPPAGPAAPAPALSLKPGGAVPRSAAAIAPASIAESLPAPADKERTATGGRYALSPRIATETPAPLPVTPPAPPASQPVAPQKTAIAEAAPVPDPSDTAGEQPKSKQLKRGEAQQLGLDALVADGQVKGKVLAEKSGGNQNKESAQTQELFAEANRQRAVNEGLQDKQELAEHEKLQSSNAELAYKTREDKKESQAQTQQAAEADAALPAAAMFKALPVNPFVMTAADHLSTFGLDTDTASYSLSRRYLHAGFLPPAGAVRTEEFVNTFDYNYENRSENTFALHAEAAPHPFREAAANLTLLKVGVKAKTIGREGRKPAHLVFVIDASGSMDKPDRLPLVQYAVKSLASQLDPRDRVTIITYNTHAQLVLEDAPAGEPQKLASAMDQIQTSGTTNLVEGLSLGYDMARRHFEPGAINRVILCSDGVANIGESDGQAILGKIAGHRRDGITLTAAGFGLGAYNDAVMQQLADKGDGNYVFIDSKDEAKRVFVTNLASTLQTVARDAKIQVEFDPAVVRRYRLLGYEKREIADKDFRNDAIDAGEIGSGQSATALYEVELADPAAQRGENPPDLGAVHVRWKENDTGKVQEISYRLAGDMVRPRTISENPRLYLAASAAQLAEVLRGSPYSRGVELPAIERVMTDVSQKLPLDKQAAELLDLIRTAKGLPAAP